MILGLTLSQEIIISLLLVIAVSTFISAIANTRRPTVSVSEVDRAKERSLKSMTDFFEILTFNAQMNGRTIDEILYDARVPRNRDPVPPLED